MSGGLNGRRHPRGQAWQSGPGLPSGGSGGRSSGGISCPHLVTIALAVPLLAWLRGVS